MRRAQAVAPGMSSPGGKTLIMWQLEAIEEFVPARYGGTGKRSRDKSQPRRVNHRQLTDATPVQDASGFPLISRMLDGGRVPG